MLTHLDRLASYRCLQCVERLSRVRVTSVATLTIDITPRLPPREVVYDGKLAAPEDGRAVRHRQDTCIDKA